VESELCGSFLIPTLSNNVWEGEPLSRGDWDVTRAHKKRRRKLFRHGTRDKVDRSALEKTKNEFKSNSSNGEEDRGKGEDNCFRWETSQSGQIREKLARGQRSDS
jgi:hypothetical protein